MNDKITISTFQLFTMLPDEGTARKYLEGRLWKDGCKCPKCSSGKRITPRRDGYYRCNACKLDFTIGHYWPQFRKRLAQGGKKWRQASTVYM